MPGGPTTFCAGGSVTLDAGAGICQLRVEQRGEHADDRVNASGSYTVTVTGAGGCRARRARGEVTVNPLPVASIMPGGPTTFCAGGSVTLDAGAGFSSYRGATGRATADDRCQCQRELQRDGDRCGRVREPAERGGEVTVNPLPVATIVPGGPTTFCAGGSVTLDAGAGFGSYAWSNGATRGRSWLVPVAATP